MAFNGYSLPVAIKVSQDGSLSTTISAFGGTISAAFQRVQRDGETAAKAINRSFDFSGAKREVDALARSIEAFKRDAFAKQGDLLGIRGSLANLGASALQQQLNEQVAAERALDAQRAQASRERLAQIDRETAAALEGVRARQAAQAAAFRQAEQEGLALVKLDQQRAVELARLAAAPQQVQAPIFNPAGLQQAAAAAEQFAREQRELATAANLAVEAADNATIHQRGLAVAMGNAAEAAENEAARVRGLANAQAALADAAQAAGIRIANANDGVEGSVRGQRFATIQASQQFQDFFVQLQSGQNVLVAFSQQASQLAFVMQGAGGAAGRFAAFMSGGWGTAIFAGISVLSLLVATLGQSKKATDEHVESTEDLIKAIDELHAATIRQTQSTQASITAQLNDAIAKRERAKATREAAIAELQFAKAAAASASQDAVGGRAANFGAQYIAQNAEANVAALDAQIEQLTKSIGKSNETVRLLRGQQIGQAVREKLDPATAATGRYERAVDALNSKLAKGKITEADYAQQLEAAARARDAALKAAEKSGRSSRSSADRQADRQALADAKVIGTAADEVANANARYAAEMTRIRGQLSSGAISRDAAKQMAAEALTVRNAAIEAAKGLDQLGERLGRDFQEFDGEARFIDRIQAAREDLEQLRAALANPDNLGQVKIGDRIFSQTDADNLEARLNAAYLKPITDATRSLDEQRQIDEAILAGREDEAEYLRLKFSILQQYGDLTEAERVALEAQLGPLRQHIELEHQRNRAIEQRQQLIDIQVQAARDLQRTLTDFIADPFSKGSLKSLIKGLADIRKRAFAETLSVKLFGDLGADVRDALTRASGPFGPAVADIRQAAGTLKTDSSAAAEAHKQAASQSKADLNSAATGLQGAAKDLSNAAAKLGGVEGANDNEPSVTQLATTPTAFGADPGEIVVNGYRPGDFSDLFGTALSGLGTVGGAVSRKAGTALDAVKVAVQKQLKIQQASPLLSPRVEALATIASMAGGKVGAVGDALLGINQFQKLGKSIAKNIGGQFGEVAGGAVQGIGIGLAADSVVKLLGIKGSKTGGAIGGAAGGAIGTAVGGPLGGVIGGIIGGTLGSIVGGVFKKKPKGRAVLGLDQATGELSSDVSGNKASAREASSDAGQAVIQAIKQIAEQLGGTIGGPVSTTIGTYKGNYRVNTTGSSVVGGLRGSEAENERLGLFNFGSDSQAAVEFAIQDMIKDGVIRGIRASTKKLLTAGGDLQKAIDKAVKFEGIFTELKRYTDPVGAALDDVNKQFDELRKIAAEAGASQAELADLEKLYGIKRAEAVKAAAEQMTGTLQSLFKDLTYRGDTGLSLRTRESRAQAAFSPLAGVIRGGGRVDQDEFAEAAQAYLDISREIYGSTAVYFQRLQDVTSLTAKAIQNAGGTVSTLSAQVQHAAQAAYQPATAPTPAQAALNTAVANDNSVGTVFNVQPVVDAIGGQNRLLETKLDEVISRLDRIASSPVAQPSATSVKSLLRQVARNI